jgi:uncharacterized membrane protein
MIHSGGFYQLEKTMISPSEIPRVLHWFKWEAYATWISGIFLLGIVYYTGSGVYLIDSQIADLSYGMAVSISLGTILAAWLVYDSLWASSLGEKGWVPVVISFVLLFEVIWWFHQWFGSRAAYIHVGAVMGNLDGGKCLAADYSIANQTGGCCQSRQNSGSVFGNKSKATLYS